jgi:hypothetical protein
MRNCFAGGESFHPAISPRQRVFMKGVGTARPQYLEAQELGTSRPHPAQEWSLTQA